MGLLVTWKIPTLALIIELKQKWQTQDLVLSLVLDSVFNLNREF